MRGVSGELLSGGGSRLHWIGNPTCRGCGRSGGFEYLHIRRGRHPGVAIVCASCWGWWWARLPAGGVFPVPGGVRLSCVEEGVHEELHEEVAGEAPGGS